MGAGRLREFDKDHALDDAMELFWRDGYNGTSLSDLTTVMGINKPSLYAAFGNKETLFISALNQYVHKHGTPHINQLHTSNTNLTKRLQSYLKSIAKMQTDPKLPGGCFIVTSTCETRSHCLPIDALQTITKINEATTKALFDFFVNEKKQGNLTTTSPPDVLASYLLTLQYGLAVMARNGAKRNELDQVIDHSISVF